MDSTFLNRRGYGPGGKNAVRQVGGGEPEEIGRGGSA